MIPMIAVVESSRTQPPPDDGRLEPADHPSRLAKDALRDLIRTERQTRSEKGRRAAARGLRDVFMEMPQLRGARCVALYVSRREEPGTQFLRAELAARGVRVVLPVTSGAGCLRWLPDCSALPEPRAERHGRRRTDARRTGLLDDVEIVLVPALAVDTLGRRLGRGHDGYDRVLRRIGPTRLVLCAVHDSEVFDAAVEPVPEDPHDVLVDAVITPTRILYLPRHSARRRTVSTVSAA
jgi:5-formyltetrahydrofolate cyclo-ligase